MRRYRAFEMKKPMVGITYGIIGEEWCGGKWTKVAVVPDVAVNKRFVEELAKKCTKWQLSAVQILDIVIDAIS